MTIYLFCLTSSFSSSTTTTTMHKIFIGRSLWFNILAVLLTTTFCVNRRSSMNPSSGKWLIGNPCTSLTGPITTTELLHGKHEEGEEDDKYGDWRQYSTTICIVSLSLLMNIVIVVVERDVKIMLLLLLPIRLPMLLSAMSIVDDKIDDDANHISLRIKCVLLTWLIVRVWINNIKSSNINNTTFICYVFYVIFNNFILFLDDICANLISFSSMFFFLQ